MNEKLKRTVQEKFAEIQDFFAKFLDISELEISTSDDLERVLESPDLQEPELETIGACVATGIAIEVLSEATKELCAEHSRLEGQVEGIALRYKLRNQGDVPGSLN